MNFHSKGLLIIQSTLLLDLDFNVHAGRQIELHQSVNSFVCRIDDVHQSLVSSDFKLIAAGLVDVRAAKNIEALNACGQRIRASDNSTGSLAGINDFLSLTPKSLGPQSALGFN